MSIDTYEPDPEAQRGSSFEREIGELLSLAGFDIKREMLVGHKRIDLYAVERRLGSFRRIAVECKNHNRKLTQAEVSLIYSNYLPLCSSNLLDEILLVTAEGLAPSALTMVESTRELSHMTSSEIFDLVMDFRPYLHGLQRQFDENGLSTYYIPPRTTEGDDFENLVIDWISMLGAAPIAILGGYGTGKTTFAKKMANLLSVRALKSRSHRIPILVRLGDISSEQSLEGLLGKLFTAHSVVRNYTFDLFMMLNRQGRFAIFLDGFDEMKHALSWAEFKYNFRQLNRLIEKNSKIVILGRPTAFLNDDEYRFALRGLRDIKGVNLRDPEWPEYRELHLAAFTEDQSRTFLRRYLTYKLSTAADAKTEREIRRVIDEQIGRAFGRGFSDLARRPVQLKMLAEVLPTWRHEIKELTVSRLYSYFIDLIIEREQEKLARQRFGLPARRAFARDIAMFLWINKGEMSITADTIPSVIVSKHASQGDDLEAVKRDLVSACFLERKLGDSLFFPHRSFQEFLFAEELVDSLTHGRIRFPEASRIANEEVSEFIEDMIDMDILRQWENRLDNCVGKLSRRFAEIWFSQAGSMNYLWNRLDVTKSPWYPALLTLAAREGRLEAVDCDRLLSIMLQRMEGPVGRNGLVCFWCALLLSRNNKTLGMALQKLTRLESYNPQGTRKIIFTPDHDVVRLFYGISVDAKSGRVIISQFYADLLELLEGYCLIGEKSDDKPITPYEFDRPETAPISLETADAIQEFQFKFCGKKKRGSAHKRVS